MVVVVLVLLMGITGVMVDRSLADGRRTRDQQDRAAALAVTDLGLSELVTVAAQEPGASVERSGSTSGAEWSGRALRAAADRWEVLVTGTAGRGTRTVRAALVRAAGGGWAVREWREGSANLASTSPTSTTTSSAPSSTTSTTTTTTSTTTTTVPTNPGLVSTVSSSGSQMTWWNGTNANGNGEWVARVVFRNDWIRNQYLTVRVVKYHSNGSQSTSTVTEHYVPPGGTSELAMWANALTTSGGTRVGVVRIEFTVTAARSYDAGWQPFSGSVTGPTVTVSSPLGG